MAYPSRLASLWPLSFINCTDIRGCSGSGLHPEVSVDVHAPQRVGCRDVGRAR